MPLHKHDILNLLPLAVGLALATTASATDYTFNLAPSDINNGILSAGGTGGESIPIGLADSPIGWESGSFVSNIDGAGNRYSQLYVNLPLALGVSSITLDDLAGIKYFTKEGTTNALDWALRIYTKPVAGVTSFYQYRFDSINPAGSNEWSLWDANTAGWFTNVSDRSNGGNTNTAISQSLSQLTGNYSGDLLYFSLFTGASGNTSPLSNGLDGLVVTMANGDAVRINMVPEPVTASFLVLGSLLLLRRPRRTC
ncbi:MAG: hypothetical protein JWL59_4963 [Chthoniobacteraceae bacterium]|nr:hypothetical protein [Chthoniobacteraceae bacterium]